MIPGYMPVPGTSIEFLPERCRAAGAILSRVGEKWTVLVVLMLASGPRRFSELKRLVEGISHRMLTLTLRGLERDGLVQRTVFPTNPPRVDYELTALGHSLHGPLLALGLWAIEHGEELDKARSAFDSRQAEAAT